MPSTSLPPLSLHTRAELYTQLAALENAGLPALKAFATIKLARDVQPRLVQVQALLARRGDIALAGERSGLFTKLDARLIQVALNAGSPGRMYQRLADVYTLRAAQAATVKSRLMLPAFILLAALFIGPLPSLVNGAIGLGGYVWQVVRPLLAIAALYFIGCQLQARLPVLSALQARRKQRDFFESLALMLEAGISMLEALPAALETIDDEKMRGEFAGIAPQVAKGATLAQALARQPDLRSGHLVSFVETGESSGTLPEMLFRHTALETDSINGAYEQLAVWAPRFIYGLVVLWMTYSLISGSGVASQMPVELR